MVILVGIFLVLHGLVHFLYFGQSARFFELQPNMNWPDNAWLFAPFFEKRAVRVLASFYCILSGIGFILSGIAVFSHHNTWYILAIGAAAFSSFGYFIFWNGKLEKIHDQGAIGILINIAVIISITILGWPSFNF